MYYAKRRGKYGRKRVGRRRRRVSFWHQKYSTKDLALSAWKGVKYIKGLVNSEMYKLDQTNMSSTFYSDGTACTHMTPVAVGDGDGQRTGNSILAKYLTISGVATRSTSGDAVQSCRIVVVLDTQNVADETNPGYSTIFSSASPFAPLNALTVGRFSILADRIFTLDTVKNLSKPIKINLPLNLHVRYNGNNATDVQRNSIWLFTISTQATSNQPIFSYFARLGYHDN